MSNYTILKMFENPRRGRQARNFTTNAPKILDLKSSSEQIFSRKLPLENCRWNLQHSRFFFGNKKLVFTVQDKWHYRSTPFFPIHVQLGKTTDLQQKCVKCKTINWINGRHEPYVCFFSYSRPPRPRSQINMTDCGLERYIVF